MQLREAVKKLQDLYQDVESEMLDEAVWLCAHDLVRQSHPGTFLIREGDGADALAVTVESGACDGHVLDEKPPVTCVHRVAVELFLLLQDETPQGDAGGVVVPIIERHIERVVSGALCTESPYSVNCTVEDVDGYNLMFTVRKRDSKEFFQTVQGLRGWLKDKGYRPVQRGYRDRASATGNGHSIETSLQPQPVQQNADKANEKTFDADKLLGSFDAEREKIDWKVKGVKIFRDYGIRVWPEVLEAAGITPAPARVESLVGYKAYYIEKEGKDPGKTVPDKIVRLVKAA